MCAVREPQTLEAVQSLQVDVNSLASHVKDLCDRFGRKRRLRRHISPNRDHAPLSVRITARRHRAGRQPAPSLRAHADDAVQIPPRSNYTDLPPRRNASNRIFRPRKLEYEAYRSERKVRPILLGGAVTAPPG
jgi:hypothetical protein